MNTEGYKDTNDAEFWHGKAVELAVNFLPSNAPLVNKYSILKPIWVLKWASGKGRWIWKFLLG